MLTIQNVKDSFDRLKRDTSDVSTTLFIEWTQFCIDYVWRKLLGTDPGRWISTSTVTKTTSVNTTALPATFGGMEHYDCGLFELDSTGTTPTMTKLARTSYGSASTGYYLEGSNIHWTPTPTETKTYSIRFVTERPSFTALSDYLTTDKTLTGTEIIPDDFREYMVRAIDVLYSQWDEDPGAEGMADQRYTRILDDLITELRREPNPFYVQDFSTMY